MRLEQLFARQAYHSVVLNTDPKERHKVKFLDFLRYHEKDAEPERPMTGEDLAKMYGAVRKPNGK
jgi:hypothetical protein